MGGGWGDDVEVDGGGEVGFCGEAGEGLGLGGHLGVCFVYVMMGIGKRDSKYNGWEYG